MLTWCVNLHFLSPSGRSVRSPFCSPCLLPVPPVLTVQPQHSAALRRACWEEEPVQQAQGTHTAATGSPLSLTASGPGDADWSGAVRWDG